jgi:DNA-binding MarR family transcriptional regulator
MSSPPDIYALDHLLAHVSHLHHDRARTLFDTIGLYRGQPPVLRALEEQEGLSHSELAARLGIRPATVSKMLDRMEKAGFLTRQPDPVDQRISRVFLTAHGHAVQDEVKNLFATMAHDSFAGLAPDEVATLYALLTRVCENLARVGGHEPLCGAR